ncbi:hypothetical protein MCC93_19040 [Morococcus cerebrosus]|uniref:Uncharacterized protein n=1 Tax=Morococcus cerebrosus TaxID=1056807 RepID=A0A0C1GJJ8_9NEIS|nr:hypothetical protein MCC93_19040 [Morococcus cerebrosus]
MVFTKTAVMLGRADNLPTTGFFCPNRILRIGHTSKIPDPSKLL